MIALLLALVPQHVDPARYTSDDGQWILEVDPTDEYGAGPADYRCSRGGGVAWEGRLPFTLYGARVLDDGFVAACANTKGRIRGAGELLVVRVTPRGSARVCAAALMNEPRMFDSCAWPWVSELSLSASPPLFRVMLATYPEGPFTGWRYLDWRFDWPSGDAVSGSPRTHSSWSASEWRPEPFRAPHVFPEPLELIDVHALVESPAHLLGAFELDTPLPRHNGSVAVARDGRIAVFDFQSGALELHDANGRLRASAHAPGSHSPGAIDALADGGWGVQGKPCVRFDADGVLTEATSTMNPLVRELPQSSAAPSASWRTSFRGVELVTSSDDTTRRVERGTDGRWLKLLYDLVVTPDGGAVVLDVSADDDFVALHVLSSEGELTRTLRMLGEPWGGRIGVAGSTLFVPRGTLGVLAIDLRTYAPRRLVLCTETDVGYRDRIVPVHDGRELWRFRTGSTRVERYAVPR